jgi:hypothetical protein
MAILTIYVSSSADKIETFGRPITKRCWMADREQIT